MMKIKDILIKRNYSWTGELKALAVIDLFKKEISRHNLLKEFAPSIMPRFYKAGVLFVSTPHPTIAHRLDEVKPEIIENLNKELMGRVCVREFCYLSDS